MKSRTIITSIQEYLNEQQINNELIDFTIKENVYYHGTSSDVKSDFVYVDKIKAFDEGNTNWSKQVQGLGKFYTSSILNAYSYIDFRINSIGTIVEIYYKSEKPYDAKNVLKLMTILKDYRVENNIESISEGNKMFIQYLIDEGYDSIIIKEGPSYNPNSSKLKSKVIIPLIKQDIKILKTYNAKSRNGGIYEKIVK